MADNVIAPLDSTLTLNERLVSAFLRDTVNIGIVASQLICLKPVKEIAKTDREFVFSLPSINDYVDLRNIQLYVRGQILERKDGVDVKVDAGTQVMLCNNVIHTLFDTISICIGNNQIELYESNHALKAYIRQLFRNKNGQYVDGRMSGLQFETRKDKQSDFASGVARVQWTQASNEVEFMGLTLTDFMQTDSYLPPQCPMRIVYRMSPEKFYILTEKANAGTDYYFQINEIYLQIPTVKINPELSIQLESLFDKEPARLSFESINVRQFTLADGLRAKTFNRVFDSKLPQKILVGFYSQDSLVGARDESPLLCELADVTNLKLYVNGIALREHVIDYAGGIYMKTYRSFLDFFGNSETDFPVTHTVFPEGCRLYAFDLLNNCNDGLCSQELLKSGYIDLEVTFKDKLDKYLVMVVYSLSPDVLDINKKRECRLTRAIL